MKTLKLIITNRPFIHLFLAIALYFLASFFKIPLLYIIGGVIILGVMLGKFFCRWMCPIGYMMEMMLSKSSDKNERLNNTMMYYKAGCPIAWITGLLNKYSFIKIKRDEKSCTSCGLCDKACYISTVNTEFSLYKKEKKDPAKDYKCSKCLECIKDCPTNSLSL